MSPKENAAGRAVTLLGAIGSVALDLRRIDRPVQLKAMRYMRDANPPLWRWLRDLLDEREDNA